MMLALPAAPIVTVKFQGKKEIVLFINTLFSSDEQLQYQIYNENTSFLPIY